MRMGLGLSYRGSLIIGPGLIHYCVFQSIDDQYGKRVVNRTYFQFSQSEDALPGLNIKLSTSRPGPRWLLALEGNKHVSCTCNQLHYAIVMHVSDAP